MKVTAVMDNGHTIQSGWMSPERGEEYAAAMATRGCVVVKQYKR